MVMPVYNHSERARSCLIIFMAAYAADTIMSQFHTSKGSLWSSECGALAWLCEDPSFNTKPQNTESRNQTGGKINDHSEVT